MHEPAARDAEVGIGEALARAYRTIDDQSARLRELAGSLALGRERDALRRDELAEAMQQVAELRERLAGHYADHEALLEWHASVNAELERAAQRIRDLEDLLALRDEEVTHERAMAIERADALAACERELAARDSALAERDTTIASMRRTRVWRIATAYWRLRGR